MKKMLFAAVATASVVLSGSASAQIDEVYGTQPELDAQCDALLNPSDNSGFVTFADAGTETSTTVTVDDGASTTAGIGTSVLSMTNHRDARVNGQSVNIHALVDFITTYAAGATVTTPTKTTVTTSITASCHVHKLASGHSEGNEEIHPGYNVAPPGLQITDLVSIPVSEVVTYGTRTDTIQGPWIDPAATTYGSQVVICISPVKNSNTWRNANGYTGSIQPCSRTWYNTLGSTPSVSLPTS